eukprot:155203-Pyramimonas_sp.AAC.1
MDKRGIVQLDLQGHQRLLLDALVEWAKGWSRLHPFSKLTERSCECSTLAPACHSPRTGCEDLDLRLVNRPNVTTEALPSPPRSVSSLLNSYS